MSRNDPYLPRNDPYLLRNDPYLPRNDPYLPRNDTDLFRNDPAYMSRNDPAYMSRDDTSHRPVKNAAVIFITPANKTILVRMAQQPNIGKWAVPGGHIDQLPDGTMEDPYRAALREFNEETSFEIDEKAIRSVEEYVMDSHRTSIFIIHSTQQFPDYDPNAVKDGETDALAYVKMRDLARYALDPRVKLRNRDTIQRLFKQGYIHV